MIFSIEDDLIAMQLEQLMTMKKELLHLQRITHFYCKNKEAPYIKTFRNIANSIQHYIDYIARIKKFIDKLHDKKEPYIFLAYHAFINKHIEEVLNGLKTNNIQISQEYEEFLDQFIPRPYLSRRYSSKSISIFIENQLNEILEKEATDLRTSVYWGYRNGYKMHPDEDMNEYKIETPFYYHELPYLIPNLFHELNHIVDSYRGDSERTSKYMRLEDKIKNIIDEKSGYWVDSKIDDDWSRYDEVLIPKIDKGLAEEIASDIFACDILGASYVFSAFHAIVSDNANDIFLIKKDNTVQLTFIDYFGDDFSEENKDTEIAKNFSKFFEIHLRLWIISMYVLEDHFFNLLPDAKDYLEKIITFLAHIFSVDMDSIDIKQEFNLEYAYSNKEPTYKDGFVNMHKAFQYMYSELRNPVKEHIREQYDTEIDYESIFNNIWKERIVNKNVVMHRNILRKEILQKVFNTNSGSENE